MRILFLLLTTVVAVNGRCGTGFIQGPSLSECYKFVTKGAHWYAAEWRCLSLGGHLASVSDAFASSFLEEEVPSCCSGYYWLGGSKDDQDVTWEWSDGSQFSYVNWDASQPVTGSPLCLAASTTSGKWSAQPCYHSMPYVCRVPATDDVCPTPTPPCNDNSKATGVCNCGGDTCLPNQYCHWNLYPTCYVSCPASGPGPATGCQCATASDNGDVCTAAQYCQSDGTCWTPPPAPTACPAGSPTYGFCTCKDILCVKGQTCTTTGDVGTCSPVACPALPGAAPAGGCVCGTNGNTCIQEYICTAATGTCTPPPPPACPAGSTAYGVCTCRDKQCVKGQTCTSAGDVGTCSPVTCSWDSYAPAGGCICGDNGAMCNQDDFCTPATGTCTPPPPPTCPAGSRATAVCICKATQCVPGQTCDDSGTGVCSPPTCPGTGGAPAGSCICGDSGNTCIQDYTCTPATGTCMAPDMAMASFFILS